MEFEPINIYCDLDALLDTRLATLCLLDHNKVDAALHNGYYTRLCDEFHDYDTAQFQEAYANRDLNTLALAGMTESIDFIRFFADATLKASVVSPLRRQPRLVLNFYPYQLGDSAKKLIVSAIKYHTEGLIDISTVYQPYVNFTPADLKAEYGSVVMYEYWRWLEIHSENKKLEEVQLPAVKFICPAIMTSKKAVEILQGMDIFTAIQEHASPFIGLTLYPISKFSLDLKRAIEFTKKP